MNNDTINLDNLVDIPVTFTVEVGSRFITIKELNGLSRGSVVELDKPVGDLLLIKVNGKTVAKGEIVVVNNKLGIRVVELLTVEEKIKL